MRNKKEARSEMEQGSSNLQGWNARRMTSAALEVDLAENAMMKARSIDVHGDQGHHPSPPR